MCDSEAGSDINFASSSIKVSEILVLSGSFSAPWYHLNVLVVLGLNLKVITERLHECKSTAEPKVC